MGVQPTNLSVNQSTTQILCYLITKSYSIHKRGDVHVGLYLFLRILATIVYRYYSASRIRLTYRFGCLCNCVETLTRWQKQFVPFTET